MILSVPTNVHLRKQPTDYNELLVLQQLRLFASV